MGHTRTTIKHMAVRARDAVAWRVHKLLGDHLVYGALLAGARRWRQMLRRPVFIGVAGSAGKTTTKELLLGLLAHKGMGVGNIGSFNNVEEIAKALLRARPSHDFFVTELSEDRPGAMDQPLALTQPSVGIITVFEDDHRAAFDSRQAVAAEMGKLVAALPVAGTAVLNADDPMVLAMATRCIAKVITCGVSPAAELRAQHISSVWPDRLEMMVEHGGERVRLRTQLCGTHWVPSVLGAIGGGLAVGRTLEECAQGIASVAPFDGRMQPVTMTDGVTFIRDDFKAPLWTLDACFEFMRTARAARKIMVIGELSDVGPEKGKKYARAAAQAQDVADLTVFVGHWSSSVLKARKVGAEGELNAFVHVQEAAQYINSISRPGDLVMLKGTNKQDHLARIPLSRSGEVNCWRDDCRRVSFCNQCSERMSPSGAPQGLSPLPAKAIPGTAASDIFSVAPDEQVIVGLGNPEPRYAGTPHNIGYEVVDQIATCHGLSWTAVPDAWITRGSSQGEAVCLLKIATPMNSSGTGLRQLSQRMRFKPEQCLLVFDDLAMPLGSVRTRLSGGAGGHRGVASILEAFQTDAFRRVKVGVGQAAAGLSRIEYVLKPYAVEDRSTVEDAIVTAQARVLELIKAYPLTRAASRAP